MSDIIYLDLKKEPGTVPQGKLLIKLEKMGNNTRMFSLFLNYLKRKTEMNHFDTESFGLEGDYWWILSIIFSKDFDTEGTVC